MINNKKELEEFFCGVKNTAPFVKNIPEFKPTGRYENIEAVTFEGVSYRGEKTKVFAYVAYPEGACENTPGIVLIHGGAGHAYLPWVKAWCDRGYSVIAPDTVGHMPTEVNAGETEADVRWKKGLFGVFEEEGYVSAPDNDDMASYDENVEDRWLVHITSQSMLAFSILAQSGRADKNKIGVMGISWGAVAISYQLGYDERPAFAIPVYGSGYLAESLAWMKDKFAHPKTREYFLAEERFQHVKMPILWQCWNDDHCFSVTSNSKSYIDTVKNNDKTLLSAVDGMGHSHGFAWIRKEPFVFADSIVKNGASLQRFTSLPSLKDPECTYVYDGSINAKIYYITEKMTYSKHEKYGLESTFMDQVWRSAPAFAENGKITAVLPNDVCEYYIEISNDDGDVVTTPIIK